MQRPIGTTALVALAALLLVSSRSAAQLTSLDSETLEIVYPGEAFSYVVPHIAACSENALRFHQNLYQYASRERIKIFLEDFSDFGHGGANTVPTNFVNLGVAPFNYVYETVPAVDRMFWMANHELAHVVTMDQAAGRDLVFRRLLGGKVEPIAENPLSIYYNYLTNPRWNAPRWYHEGIAVFLETWMAGGLGRAQGAYDEMVFRSMVRDDADFYDVVGLESEGTTVDFQVGVNSYLYGTRFMTYLAKQYGPEKLIEWTARKPGSKAHFARQFRHVYGTALDVEWSRWIAWEREWQTSNLAAIRNNPTTPFRSLADVALGSVSRSFIDADSRRLYLAIRYPGQLAHLAVLDLDSGRLEKLTDLKGAAIFYVTSLAYDPEARVLFYTTDNYGWRDLNAFDLTSGRRQRLLKDVRAGDFVFNRADRSLWGVRHYNGISTLIRIPHPYVDWNQIYSWPYGSDLYDIDLSPDGSLLTGALAEIDGTQNLISLETSDLLEGEADPEVLFNFDPSSPSNFVFSEDGAHLYGSSYYSGASNIYRYSFESGEMEPLSNAETGLFRPLPSEPGKLIAFRYTGRGFVPVEIADKVEDRVSAIRFLGAALANEHPVVRSWKAPSPAQLSTAEKSQRGTYSSARRLRLDSFYPVVEGYKDSVAGGFRLNFSDGLNLSRADLTVSYSPDSELESTERLHASLGFHHWNWELRATYNVADFYDLFGPTKTSRRGYSLGVGWGKALFYDEPRTLRLSTRITGYGDLETLPEYQNVAATNDQLLQASVSLDYEYLRKSLGAVDNERGVHWRLLAASNFVDGTTSPRLSYDLDYGVALPIDHSSLWLRTSFGHAFGDQGDPFAQYYFGGFGNNYVDRLSEKRYRESWTFPGLELNEVGGRNYGKAMIEWNLPPVRFRRVGVPSFYLNWLRPGLFTSALRTDLDDSALRRTLYNFGLQLDFRLVMFSNLEATISVGYAVAVEHDRPSSDEVLVSLKIL